MFRDSFATWLIPLLSEHFQRIVFSWQYTLERELVERERPDVVIQEMRRTGIDEPRTAIAMKLGPRAVLRPPTRGSGRHHRPAGQDLCPAARGFTIRSSHRNDESTSPAPASLDSFALHVAALFLQYKLVGHGESVPMDYDVVIANGTLLSAEGETRADVAIRGETIAAVGPGLAAQARCRHRGHRCDGPPGHSGRRRRARPSRAALLRHGLERRLEHGHPRGGAAAA